MAREDPQLKVGPSAQWNSRASQNVGLQSAPSELISHRDGTRNTLFQVITIQIVIGRSVIDSVVSRSEQRTNVDPSATKIANLTCRLPLHRGVSVDPNVNPMKRKENHIYYFIFSIHPLLFGPCFGIHAAYDLFRRAPRVLQHPDSHISVFASLIARGGCTAKRREKGVVSRSDAWTNVRRGSANHRINY